MSREPIGLPAEVVVASNRAAAGVYDDTTGPLIVEALTGLGFEVAAPVVVPDGGPVGEAVDSSPEGKRQFLRGVLRDGELHRVGGPGSHLVGALAASDALIVVPEEATSLAAGDEVQMLSLGGPQ